MGEDEAREKALLPPEFPWSRQDDWTVTTGGYELQSNYMLLHENVLDLTHFNHVHANSFGFANWRPTARFMTDGNRVGFEDTYVAADLSMQEREVMGLAHPDALHNVSTGWFETPALHLAESTVYNRADAGLPETTVTKIVHMVTPVSPTMTHYWWLVGTDAALPQPMRAGYGAFIERAYREDKVVLEAIQTMVVTDPRGTSYPELSFQGDKGGVLARRALARILADEAANLSSGSLPDEVPGHVSAT